MAGPIHHDIGHAHGQVVPIQTGVRVLEVQMPRNHPVLHRQNGLDQARNARGGPQMSDVGLDGTDQKGMLCSAPMSINRGGGSHFYRVADHRAGAVCFQVVHLGGGSPCAGKSLFHGPFLSVAAGHRQALTGAVLIDRGTPDDGPDAITVSLRLAEALESQQAAALPADEAVG